MAVVMLLSCLAFLARTLPLLLILSAVNLIRSFLAALPAPVFETRTAHICLADRGYPYPVPDTLPKPGRALDRIQGFMAAVPGVSARHGFFANNISGGHCTDSTRVMSARMAFVLSTCLKFVPQLLAEIQNIYEGQVLRGARILPRDLLRPWHWPDLLHCVIVPGIVQGMALAGNIALAARARGFGRQPTPTPAGPAYRGKNVQRSEPTNDKSEFGFPSRKPFYRILRRIRGTAARSLRLK